MPCVDVFVIGLQESSGNSKRVTGTGQAWAAPRSLGQLMEILGQAKGQPVAGHALQHRIVAGNTGAGILSCIPHTETFVIKYAPWVL